MDNIYVLMPENGAEWEDLVIYVKEEDAIRDSIKYYKWRVEIFKKNENSANGYIPTYNYIKNGIIYIGFKRDVYLGNLNIGGVGSVGSEFL